MGEGGGTLRARSGPPPEKGSGAAGFRGEGTLRAGSGRPPSGVAVSEGGRSGHAQGEGAG